MKTKQRGVYAELNGYSLWNKVAKTSLGGVSAELNRDSLWNKVAKTSLGGVSAGLDRNLTWNNAAKTTLGGVSVGLDRDLIWNKVAKTSLGGVSAGLDANSINNVISKAYKLSSYLFSLVLALFLFTSSAYADYEKVECTFIHKKKTYVFNYIVYPNSNQQLQIISTFPNINDIELREDELMVKTIQSMEIGDGTNHFKLERAHNIYHDIKVTAGKFMSEDAATLGIICDRDEIQGKIGEQQIKEYKQIICNSRENWWHKTNPEAAEGKCSLQ